MVYQARDLQKSVGVYNVAMAHRPGFIARGMIITPSGKRAEEHICGNEKLLEMMYRSVYPDAKHEADSERGIVVRENPLRLELFHRHGSDGYRMCWQAPVHSVQDMVQVLAI